MTISKLQILLDINKGNEQAVLEEHACLTRHGYFFVDSIDGQCWLFDQNGKLDDIKKIDAIHKDYVKRDIKKIVIPKCVKRIEDWAFAYCVSLISIIFKGKTIDQVKAMDKYPWGIKDESIIKCS